MHLKLIYTSQYLSNLNVVEDNILIIFMLYNTIYQCLGSGSVGSARFWLPEFRIHKHIESTDPDPRRKASTKNCKKKSQNLNLNF